MYRTGMFDVCYDWDSGQWLLVVDTGDGGHDGHGDVYKKEYASEAEAEKGKDALMTKLAAAPGGKPFWVLEGWFLDELYEGIP
jgi:hypothetical protein